MAHATENATRSSAGSRDRWRFVCSPASATCPSSNNLLAHKAQQVRTLVVAHPHVHFRCTPTDSRWLTQVELWFFNIEPDVTGRGIVTSVSGSNLRRKLMRYIKLSNKTATPTRWSAIRVTWRPGRRWTRSRGRSSAEPRALPVHEVLRHALPGPRRKRPAGGGDRPLVPHGASGATPPRRCRYGPRRGRR